jgi:hypothetical protein
MPIPFVIGAYPANGSHDVRLDTDIRVYFARDIDRTTLSPTTVYLSKTDGSLIPFESISYEDKVLVCRPRDSLEPKTTYQLHLSGGLKAVEAIKDILGEPMPQSYLFSFTTEEADEEYAAPTLLEPADYSLVVGGLLLKWSGNTQKAFHVQLSLTKTFDTIVWQTIAHGLEVRPNVKLDDATYYWRVREMHSDVWSCIGTFAYHAEVEIDQPPIIEDPDSPDDPDLPGVPPNPNFPSDSYVELVDIKPRAIQVDPEIKTIRLRVRGQYNESNFDPAWINLTGTVTGCNPDAEEHGVVDFDLSFESDGDWTMITLHEKAEQT